MHKKFLKTAVYLGISSIACSIALYLLPFLIDSEIIGDAATHATIVPGILSVLLGVVAIYFYLQLEDPERQAAIQLSHQITDTKARIEAAIFLMSGLADMAKLTLSMNAFFADLEKAINSLDFQSHMKNELTKKIDWNNAESTLSETEIFILSFSENPTKDEREAAIQKTITDKIIGQIVLANSKWASTFLPETKFSQIDTTALEDLYVKNLNHDTQELISTEDIINIGRCWISKEMAEKRIELDKLISKLSTIYSPQKTLNDVRNLLYGSPEQLTALSQNCKDLHKQLTSGLLMKLIAKSSTQNVGSVFQSLSMIVKLYTAIDENEELATEDVESIYATLNNMSRSLSGMDSSPDGLSRVFS